MKHYATILVVFFMFFFLLADADCCVLTERIQSYEVGAFIWSKSHIHFLHSKCNMTDS